ncbi:hypothetical protein [Mycobacterium paraffinicum]|uniref:hypothetical protein n=1 Tax=Mycobacterium paraffinicum TaxID=53378 RepID=UPI0026B8F31F
MNNVIVGRINPRSGKYGIAVSYLACKFFCTPFLEYESALIPGDPLAADLVEPISRH